MSHGTGDGTQRELFGLPVDALTMDQAIARCTGAIDHGQQLSIGVINAAKVVSMQRNPQLRQAVAECDMVLADGQAVVWASRILGAPLPERVAGVDLFMNLLAAAEQRGDRVYFLGARPEVLARMLEQVGRQFPRLLVAGAHDGYYQAGQEGESRRTSAAARPTSCSWACPRRARNCSWTNGGRPPRRTSCTGWAGRSTSSPGSPGAPRCGTRSTAWNGCTGPTRNQCGSAAGT